MSRPARSETNMPTHPPRLLGGPAKSSLDSVEIVAVCRKRLPTTHAAVVSARAGGHGRDDVQIDRNMVGRRLENLQPQFDVQILHQAVVACSQLGVTDGRCVVEVESRLYLARRRHWCVSSLQASCRASQTTG
jgi:hypothetical protein